LGQTLGSAILGAILISSLSANLASGIAKSRVIPQAQKTEISQAVKKQSSNIEFGNGANLGSQIPQAIVNEIISISHTSTVDATKGTLAFGVSFILLTLIVSTNLPGGYYLEERHAIAGSFRVRKKRF
jgi:hypothetical protein